MPQPSGLLRICSRFLAGACLAWFAGDASAQSLILNELLADPPRVTGDANGDGTVDPSEDEFLEIVNVSAQEVDVSGWRIEDGFGLRHEFPAGSRLSAGCALVVFGGGEPAPIPGALVQRSSTGLLGFNNSGDTVRLLRSDGSEAGAFDYGSEGGRDHSLVRSPELEGGPFIAHPEASPTGAPFSPGQLATGDAFTGCEGGGPIGGPGVEAWEVQGESERSPFEGQRVELAASVVTAVGAGGFFVQTPDDRSDDDDATSDGLFVASNLAAALRAGDLVEVTGTCREEGGLTLLSSARWTILERGRPLPTAVELSEDLPSPGPPGNYEAIESQLVVLRGLGVATGPSDLDGIFHAKAGEERAFREAGLPYPGLDERLPVWDGDPEVFAVDPDAFGLADRSVAGGAIITQLRGVFRPERGERWLFLPTRLQVQGGQRVESVRAREAGELTIASQNLRNFFDDQDDPGGDSPVSSQTFERRLTKGSLLIRNVLRAPDVLCVQECENLRSLERLATRLRRDDPRLDYRAVHLGGQDPGFRHLGFLVRSSLDVVTARMLGASDRFTFGNSFPVFSRPPLELVVTTAGPEAFRLTVLNVHLRSRLGLEDGGFAQARRFEQAMWLARYVRDFQADEPEARLLIAGDFNAFEFTDGRVDTLGIATGRLDPRPAVLEGEDLIARNLHNRSFDLAAEDRYTFVFDGVAEVLDHVLTNDRLDPHVSHYAIARSSADRPIEEAFGDSAARFTDHDAPVIFLRPEISTARTFRRGDLDGGGIIDLSDPIAILAWLFLGGQPACLEAGDTDDNGEIDLSDAVALLGFLFLGQAPPAAPWPSCGSDAESPFLGCDADCSS